MLHTVSPAQRATWLNQPALASGRRLGYFFAVLGVASLATGAAFFCQERRFLVEAERAVAIVVAVEQGRNRQGTTYTPVLAFNDGKGQEHRVKSGASGNPASLAAGETAVVFYSPDDPARWQRDGFLVRWGTTLIFGIPGALLTTIGYIGAGIFEWLERQPPRRATGLR